jgi:hypothetical protein
MKYGSVKDTSNSDSSLLRTTLRFDIALLLFFFHVVMGGGAADIDLLLDRNLQDFSEIHGLLGLLWLLRLLLIKLHLWLLYNTNLLHGNLHLQILLRSFLLGFHGHGVGPLSGGFSALSVGCGNLVLGFRSFLFLNFLLFVLLSLGLLLVCAEVVGDDCADNQN